MYQVLIDNIEPTDDDLQLINAYTRNVVDDNNEEESLQESK